MKTQNTTTPATTPMALTLSNVKKAVKTATAEDLKKLGARLQKLGPDASNKIKMLEVVVEALKALQPPAEPPKATPKATPKAPEKAPEQKERALQGLKLATKAHAGKQAWNAVQGDYIGRVVADMKTDDGKNVIVLIEDEPQAVHYMITLEQVDGNIWENINPVKAVEKGKTVWRKERVSVEFK